MAERIKTELNKLKRNRGYYAGTITKAHNRLLRMLDGDPATHDQELLEKMRSSINRVETQYEESRTDVEYTWATGDHGTSLASLTISLDKLRVTLDGSTIQGDHPLRQEATKFENHLCRLTTKEKKSDSPPTFTTTPAPTTGHKTHHLPKMTLPTFHGDLMACTSKHCRTLTKTIPVKNTFFLNFVADGLALDTALEKEQGKHSKPVVKTDSKSYCKVHSKQNVAVHTSTAPPPVQQTPSSPELPPSYQGFRFNCILCSQKHPTFLCPICPCSNDQIT